MVKPRVDTEFRKAVADVKPLAPARRVALRRSPPPPPEPLHTRRDEQAALCESLDGPLTVDDALDTGEELVFLREGLGRQLLRRLRRGRWVVQDNLDLHGMNRVQAAFCVAQFLVSSNARGLRCVRIVHGKGLGSTHRQPVLKLLMRRWLTRRDEVLAYCQAPASSGGAGALLVLLRGRR